MTQNFADYKSWKEDYENRPVYTRKQMNEILKQQAKQFTINRVIRSLTGKYGPTECVAMYILAIHKTPEGIIVIVQ